MQRSPVSLALRDFRFCRRGPLWFRKLPRVHRDALIHRPDPMTEKEHRLPSVPCLLATLAISMLAFAGVAIAEVTEENDLFKAQVEPICKTNKQASDKYLKGVRRLVQQDKLKQAGDRFSKAATALDKAQRQLAAIEQPPAEAAKLDKWLAGIKAQVAQMRTIAAKFKAGEKSRATSLVVQLTHAATVTNNIVVSFAFNYCRIDPAK